MSSNGMIDEIQAVPDEVREEARIVERVRAGDQEAFGVLLKVYQRRIFNFIRGMVRNNEDAEDITQEAFVKALFGIRSLKNPASFKSWLFRIAHNLSLDFVRKKRPKLVDTEEHLRESYVDESTPREELTREYLRRHVRKCLDLLNEQQRSILVLCDLEGLSYREISEALEIPFGTVQSRIFYARKRLKDHLERSGLGKGGME